MRRWAACERVLERLGGAGGVGRRAERRSGGLVAQPGGGAGEAAAWWGEQLGFKCVRKHASPPPPPLTENLSVRVALPAPEVAKV